MHQGITVSWVLCVICVTIAGCKDPEPLAVKFAPSDEKGRWATPRPEGPSDVEHVSSPAQPVEAAGSPANPGTGSGAQGPIGNAIAGSGASSSPQASGGSSAIGSAGAASTATISVGIAGRPADTTGNGTPGDVAPFEFDVLTAVQHKPRPKSDPNYVPAIDDNCWGPSNMGAIWIEKDGQLVKVLEAWGKGVYSKHLVTYRAAGGTVDVITKATMSSHAAHHATWDLTNRQGERVKPDKYKLRVEVADYDYDEPGSAFDHGEVFELEFDTRVAPQTITPEESAYYTSMKLQLR